MASKKVVIASNSMLDLCPDRSPDPEIMPALHFHHIANLRFAEKQKFNQSLLWVILLSTYIPLQIRSIQEPVHEYAKEAVY